jgi:hypothetical protein
MFSGNVNNFPNQGQIGIMTPIGVTHQLRQQMGSQGKIVQKGQNPLISNLKMSGKKEQKKGDGNKNFLLNQLNFGDKEQPKHPESGYLQKSTSGYFGMERNGQKVLKSKDKIEKIFSRIKIPKKRKSDEKKEELGLKMDKLRSMIFPHN